MIFSLSVVEKRFDLRLKTITSILGSPSSTVLSKDPMLSNPKTIELMDHTPGDIAELMDRNSGDIADDRLDWPVVNSVRFISLSFFANI